MSRQIRLQAARAKQRPDNKPKTDKQKGTERAEFTPVPQNDTTFNEKWYRHRKDDRKDRGSRLVFFVS